MKLFVFIKTGNIVCLGVIAENYDDALEVMGPNWRLDVNNTKYPLELKHTFELKEGKRGIAFQVEE